MKLILVELTAAAARFRGAPVGTAGTNMENNVVHTNLILHASTPRSWHKEQIKYLSTCIVNRWTILIIEKCLVAHLGNGYSSS